jgi:uncharacterized membrane protein YhhN
MILPLLLGGMVLLNWFAVLTGRTRLDDPTKPAVILILITWFASEASPTGPGLWFLAGLVFSLAGDVILNLPARYFPYGLGAFALTHGCYSTALNGLGSGKQILISAGAAVIFYLLSVCVHRAYKKDPLDPALRAPVAVYIFLIAFMLSSSIWTHFQPDWPQAAASLVSLGAVFFTFSDGVLGWDKFVSPLTWRTPGVRFNYHTGQVLLTAGMILKFST